MAATIQDQIGHFIRRGAFGVLEKMRVYLERDRRIGMAEAVLDFGDGCAPRDHSRGTAMAKGMEGHAS